MNTDILFKAVVVLVAITNLMQSKQIGRLLDRVKQLEGFTFMMLEMLGNGENAEVYKVLITNGLKHLKLEAKHTKSEVEE